MSTPCNASGVGRRGSAERFLRLDVPERMNQRDAAIDLFLRRVASGRLEMRPADVAEVGSAMIVAIMRVRLTVKRAERQRGARKRGACGDPPSLCEEILCVWMFTNGHRAASLLNPLAEVLP